MHEEVLEASSTDKNISDIVSPNPARPGGDSRANNNLTSFDGSGAVESSGRRRRSSASSANGLDTVDGIDTSQPSQTSPAVTVLRPAPRPASPAKRRASEMENGEQPEDKSRMELESEQIEDKSSAHRPEEGNSNVKVTVTGAQPSIVSRMQRSTSVDMMAEERSNTRNDSDHDMSATLPAPLQGSHQPVMSTNGNGGSPLTSNSTTAEHRSGIYSIEPTTTPPASYDEQFRRVFQLTQATTKDGQEGYLVSSKWLERVVSRSTEGKGQTFDKSASEGDVGPVDNSNIVGEGQF